MLGDKERSSYQWDTRNGAEKGVDDFEEKSWSIEAFVTAFRGHILVLEDAAKYGS